MRIPLDNAENAEITDMIFLFGYPLLLLRNRFQFSINFILVRELTLLYFWDQRRVS